MSRESSNHQLFQTTLTAPMNTEAEKIDREISALRGSKLELEELQRSVDTKLGILIIAKAKLRSTIVIRSDPVSSSVKVRPEPEKVPESKPIAEIQSPDSDLQHVSDKPEDSSPPPVPSKNTVRAEIVSKPTCPISNTDDVHVVQEKLKVITGLVTCDDDKCQIPSKFVEGVDVTLATEVVDVPTAHPKGIDKVPLNQLPKTPIPLPSVQELPSGTVPIPKPPPVSFHNFNPKTNKAPPYSNGLQRKIQVTLNTTAQIQKVLQESREEYRSRLGLKPQPITHHRVRSAVSEILQHAGVGPLTHSKSPKQPTHSTRATSPTSTQNNKRTEPKIMKSTGTHAARKSHSDAAGTNWHTRTKDSAAPSNVLNLKYGNFPSIIHKKGVHQQRPAGPELGLPVLRERPPKKCPEPTNSPSPGSQFQLVPMTSSPGLTNLSIAPNISLSNSKALV